MKAIVAKFCSTRI